MTRGQAQQIDLYLGAEALTDVTLALAQDGGAFAPPAGALVEKTGGWYTWEATAEDMDFDDAALDITHADLVNSLHYTLSTEPLGTTAEEVQAALQPDFTAISEAIADINVDIDSVSLRLAGVTVLKPWGIDPVTGNIAVFSGDTYGQHGNNVLSWNVSGIDLTGATVKFEVEGSTYQAAMLSDEYATAKWTVTLLLTGVQSTAMPEGVYWIRAYYPDGDRITLPVTGRVSKK
jgi:hypothetical protein